MAIVDLDVASILKELQRRREEFFISSRGEVETLSEQLYNQSPLNFNVIYTLESEEEKIPEQKKAIDPSGVSVGKIKNFENGDPNFQFKREPIIREKVPPKSALTLQLSGKLDKEPENLKKKYTETKLLLTIFLPPNCKPNKVKLSVNITTTVEEVINETIRTYTSLTKDELNKVLLHPESKAYILRFSEDDGTPDEDMPDIGKTQQIGQFNGSVMFVLCKNPKFLEDKPKEESTPLIFKVYLLTSGFVSVLYNDTMSLKELREIVCTKRCLPPDQHGFVHLDSLTGEFLPLNLTLGELSHKKGLRLLEKSKRSRAETKSFGPEILSNSKLVGPMYFSTPTEATRYQQFTVMKSNKFGVKQELILGIDAERIVRRAADSKKTVSKPVKFMRDVVKVALISSKTGQFAIELKNNKVYRYESPEAEYIVAKMEYLLQMNYY